MLVRFGDAHDAELRFVPAGQTLDDLPADTDPTVVHVDTGGGCFDHHDSYDPELSAAELVRRAIMPDDEAMRRIVQHVTCLDNAGQRACPSDSPFFHINDLINGYNTLFPTRPHHVAQAMFGNFDAWYESELRQLRLEAAFRERLEFPTRWGLGIAMQSHDGGSSRLAYEQGAILYVYRDGRGYMGIAAQSRSRVDLRPVYTDVRRIDPSADWYLHPSNRMLLCGTDKAPPRSPSELSLHELVDLIRVDRDGHVRRRS